VLPKNELFELKLLREEKHLALPNLTSLVLIKEIQDVLYQYLVSEEKERLLNAFLDRLRAHLSLERDGNGPFSILIDDLQFLEEEGLEELKYLNWVEIPVYVFEVKGRIAPDNDDYPEFFTTVNQILDELLVYNWVPGTNLIYAYPQSLL